MVGIAAGSAPAAHSLQRTCCRVVYGPTHSQKRHVRSLGRWWRWEVKRPQQLPPRCSVRAFVPPHNANQSHSLNQSVGTNLS